VQVFGLEAVAGRHETVISSIGTQFHRGMTVVSGGKVGYKCLYTKVSVTEELSGQFRINLL
jgi:hypothetical protein